MALIGTSHVVRSRDGTTIGYLSVGTGPALLVIPGVLSMAADCAAFARALSEHFTVHTIERRGRGESGPQGDDYSIVKECEDVLALQAETGAGYLVGHSYGGLVALEVTRNNTAFSKIVVYEPACPLMGRCQRRGCLGIRRSSQRKRTSIPWSSSRSPTRRRVI
jgi:pimeloyl-ACP methyl ester carboxylesterase